MKNTPKNANLTITIRMPESLHRKVKLFSTKKGMTMSAVYRIAVEDYLRRSV